MANILITGGAGYIGSHAAWACVDHGHELVVVDNLSTGVARNVPPAATLVEMDIADTARFGSLLRDHKIDAIMHFAGSIVVPESVVNPGLYYHNNTVKSLGLIQEAVKAGTKAFIFSSTAAVYAPGQFEPLREDATKAPLSPYGQSKLMTETMLADMSAAHGLSYGVLRYFNVAGADPKGRTGQSTPNATHLIKVACQVATGQRDQMEVFGADYPTPDGTCIRDYIHVSDLADAHVLLAQHLLSGGANVTANCGYGKGASVKEVLASLEKQLNHPIKAIMSPRRAGDAPCLVANSAHLKSLLPWKPKFESLDDIVAAALAWERHLTLTN
ncbi:UDP-glucose 4-epimerase [Candidatus Phycosocius bacilliformis]|uniref:UDP-glucose 4-epimerase n=1 Tax=Candidatus Phycosocius bacilliformis TaxID=1445552 RepID=A0A2P2E6G9_9PROT|nr:UDP-glucose 4-epimerase GalE [Candidatus Phycosocius bacilliformis]GBF56647.1 UDP-glucose 4-epimerase [Candidatus Phycosocius bacilliformis]